jgi:hypothetical protein
MSRRGRAGGDFGGLGTSGPKRGPAGQGARSSAADAPASSPKARSERRPPAPSTDEAYEAETSVNNLGTEYGESRDSHVTEVPFQRQSHSRPAQLVSLRYDDRAGLLARGIRVDPYPRPVVRTYPEAFPHNRFAPPPPY